MFSFESGHRGHPRTIGLVAVDAEGNTSSVVFIFNYAQSLFVLLRFGFGNDGQRYDVWGMGCGCIHNLVIFPWFNSCAGKHHSRHGFPFSLISQKSKSLLETLISILRTVSLRAPWLSSQIISETQSPVMGGSPSGISLLASRKLAFKILSAFWAVVRWKNFMGVLQKQASICEMIVRSHADT
ncbi:MAG TPA: hypothetical protein VGR14_08900 [Verrucomicrobiae bacterium]|nr:hypothetical protein [Verrucomicrobiae bacterium]